ncbi:Fructose-2,6-bisphosphatase [Mycoemilia scoparia]|uniref:fructose-2,6-bisphosphate 2-phosphatase n=1 Tax=Mycoemilia scoparia TaxID=417184 RepID=A0A9W7ZZ03_9FUNG|nr:Fructose-2,6-bisphosphatase [Mycoemilia scoparia]
MLGTSCSTRIAVIMVGLPARGKTYIAYKVSRYLDWLGVNCRVFNVGEYRRMYVGTKKLHTFFDPNNAEGMELRRQCAMRALGDMFLWFEDLSSGVAIYDATNSTRERRRYIYETCRSKEIEVMFVESWCDDEELIEKNIREVKRISPDYRHIDDEDEIVSDFKKRIEHYNELYEPLNCRPGGERPHHASEMLIAGPNGFSSIAAADADVYDESALTYVKKINVGSQVVINRIKSFIETRIVYFLMNIHIAPRSILFSRHGESLYNLDQRLGGDPALSPNGEKYSEALPGLIEKLMGDQELTLWTSTLKRTIQTGSKLKYPRLQWKALDELDAGVCEGLTYEEVEERHPEEYAMRNENKFEFRYRGGESYRDVVLRLEPVIMELERQQNLLIISHQAVLRCLYAYFLNIDPQDLPYLKIPLHTVMKLTWTAYGCDIQTYKVDIAAVDTHRPKTTSHKTSETGSASPSVGSAPFRQTGVNTYNSKLKSSIPVSRSGTDIGVSPGGASVATSGENDKPAAKPNASKGSIFQSSSTAELLGESAKQSHRRKYQSNFPMSAQPVASPNLSSIKPSEEPKYTKETIPKEDDFALPQSTLGPQSAAKLAQNPVNQAHENDSTIDEDKTFEDLQEYSKLSMTAKEAHPVQSKSTQRPPIIHTQTFDQLHVKGHGDIKVTESNPKVTISYSVNPDTTEQTLTQALKDELVGIDPEYTNEQDDQR